MLRLHRGFTIHTSPEISESESKSELMERTEEKGKYKGVDAHNVRAHWYVKVRNLGIGRKRG